MCVYLYFQIDIVTPNKRSQNLDFESLCRDQKSYVVFDIPAAAVIDPDLVGAFINEGKIHIPLSKKVIQTCVA